MKEIEITTGTNGYPQGLHRGYIDFNDIREAEAFARKVGGEVVLLYKKFGWQLWQSNGYHPDPIHLAEEDFGDDYAFECDLNYYLANCKDEITDLAHELLGEGLEGIKALRNHIEEIEDVASKLASLEEGEVVVTHNGRYYATFEYECMSFTHDGHLWTIGVEMPTNLTLEEFADVINNAGSWQPEFEGIISDNKWEDLTGDKNEFLICRNGNEYLEFDKFGYAEVVIK